MRRIVIRFDRGTFSFDLIPGREVEDLFRYLSLFPDREVVRVEEQVYDPSHPHRFRYVPRPDLEEALRTGGQAPRGEAEVRG